jgi:hypothetical protein
MVAEAAVQEYLDEIRSEVCSRCVERPNGGPPCLPLGKPCGVELHLPALVSAVREVHSELIEPYLNHNRREICETCTYLHGEHCPCPMDRLAVLVVEAIENVDRRHARRDWGKPFLADLPGAERPDLQEVVRAFKEATGIWTGCDWPTWFGPDGMDLEGRTAAEAEARKVEAVDRTGRDNWAAAAEWLREVERRAALAEEEASLAVAAANAESWREARDHARRAWSLEFHTGRPLRRRTPTWRPLYEVIMTLAAAHGAVELEVVT